MTRRGPPGHLTRPSRGAFFPAASGKLLLSLPAAQVPTRISPPRQQANAAEADTAAESADSNSLSRRAVDYPARPDSSPAPAADFFGAAESNTAPTVSKPALFLHRVPSMNFPAWPGQSIVQPMFVETSALPISPPVGMVLLPPCLDQQSFPSSPGL